MNLKKIISGCILMVLFAACAAGAFFFLRKGVDETKKPVLTGIEDFTIEEGEPLPDLSENLRGNQAVKQVKIDVSQVNTMQAGEYKVIYRYQSTSGENYKKEATCTVLPRKEEKKEKEHQHKKSPAAEEPAAGAVKTGEAEGFLFYTVVGIVAFGIFFKTAIYRYLHQERKI